MSHRATASPLLAQPVKGHYPCTYASPAGACTLLLLEVLVQSRGCLLLSVPLSCRSVPIKTEQPAGAGPFPERFTAAMLSLLHVQFPGGGRLQGRRKAVSRPLHAVLYCLVHSFSWDSTRQEKAWCSQEDS